MIFRAAATSLAVGRGLIEPRFMAIWSGGGESDERDCVWRAVEASPEGDADQVFGARADDGADLVESDVDDLDGVGLESAFPEPMVPGADHVRRFGAVYMPAKPRHAPHGQRHGGGHLTLRSTSSSAHRISARFGQLDRAMSSAAAESSHQDGWSATWIASGAPSRAPSA
jgi:hypothetical protein